MNILVFNKYVQHIMAKLTIDTGTVGNPATGDSLRTAMAKVNTNFDEMYSLIGDGSTGLITTDVTNGDLKLQANGTGTIEIDTLSITNSTITSIGTNSDITITPNGTGNLVLGALTVNGTTLSSSDSSKITLAESVDITGDLVVGGSFDLSGLAVGTLDVDNLNFNDNIISSDSNADINISPGGTGNVVFPGITVADNTITTSGSNANLELDAAGTGTVKVIGNLTLDDSDEIKLGDAGDLRIFHNGSHSIIREDGTGSLYLQSDNNVILSKDTSTEIMVKAIADGAVELYHNNVKKLNTGSHGVDIVDELHTEGATPHLTLKRTDNANIPTLRFKGSGGTIGASIDFQGTGGTSNELAFQVFDGSSMAEHFRVTYTGAKVTGTLDIDGGITITDNTITTAASNANLEINASGSGTVVLENLKVGTGATVTTILDEDGMDSNSATSLSTQQSIKAYVDSQVTAQDLDVAADSGTAAVDLDSQSFTVTGGTGIDTTATGQAVTVNIDSTVATLLGSQTLQNKTLTSPTVTGVLTTTDLVTNEITTNGSNAEMRISTQGTGTMTLAATNITLDAQGGAVSLNTTLHVGAGGDSAGGILIEDNTIKTARSNENLEIEPSGTGFVKIDNGIEIGDAQINYGTATTTSSSAANIDTFASATYRSAKYQVSIVDSTNTKFGIYELFVTHDGSSAYINAVGISDTGEDLATFSADIDSGSVRVRVVPISDASTVFKFVRTVFTV